MIMTSTNAIVDFDEVISVELLQRSVEQQNVEVYQLLEAVQFAQ